MYIFYNFGVGPTQQGFLGGFFDIYDNARKATNIPYSSALLRKLGIDERSSLIMGYYQNGRKISDIEAIVKQKIANNESPVLLLTGVSEYENLPSIGSLKKQYPALQIICAGKLPEAQYISLMQYVHDDKRHVFFCSGDNTFLESIFWGQLPIFLFLDDHNAIMLKKQAFDYIYTYLQQISSRLDLNDREEKVYGNICYYLSPQRREFEEAPTLDMLNLFRDKISPMLLNEFNLSRNISHVVSRVEPPLKKDRQHI